MGAVGLAARARRVAGVVGHDLGAPGRGELLPAQRGVVAVDRLVQAHQRPETVEGDVVAAEVPERPVVGDPQEGRDRHGVRREVYRPGVVRGHPRPCGGHRVVGTAQVDLVDGEHTLGIDPLVRDVVDDEAGVRRLEVTRGVEDTATEQVPVERTIGVHDVEVVGDRDRSFGVGVLGEPHAALGGRERDEAAV